MKQKVDRADVAARPVQRAWKRCLASLSVRNQLNANSPSHKAILNFALMWWFMSEWKITLSKIDVALIPFSPFSERMFPQLYWIWYSCNGQRIYLGHIKTINGEMEKKLMTNYQMLLRPQESLAGVILETFPFSPCCPSLVINHFQVLLSFFSCRTRECGIWPQIKNY